MVGFSLVRTVADESELLLIAVLPGEQRRGVGSLLLDDFLEQARDDGVRRVHLEVRDGNPAIGMYRRAGFSPVGRRRNYYHAADGKRYDAITLARRTLVKSFRSSPFLSQRLRASIAVPSGKSRAVMLHEPLLTNSGIIQWPTMKLPKTRC